MQSLSVTLSLLSSDSLPLSFSPFFKRSTWYYAFALSPFGAVVLLPHWKDAFVHAIVVRQIFLMSGFFLGPKERILYDLYGDSIWLNENLITSAFNYDMLIIGFDA